MKIEKHEQIGRLLRIAADSLFDGGPQNTKAHEALSKARSLLDDELFNEHPDLDGERKLNAYYGTAGRR